MKTIKRAHIKAKENQTVSYSGLETTFKVLSEAVHGSAAALEHSLDAKRLGAPMHKHTKEDEIIYILRGSLSVIQNGEVQILQPGQYLAMPRHIFHTYWNHTESKVSFIRIFAPGNFENHFAEMATYYRPGEEPDFEKIAETALYYGLEFKWDEHEDLIRKYGLRKYMI